MGCWHGGFVHCGPAAPCCYDPAGVDDRYPAVTWPRRRRARPEDREMRAASLEERLDQLHEELRRVEAALAELGTQD